MPQITIKETITKKVEIPNVNPFDSVKDPGEWQQRARHDWEGGAVWQQQIIKPKKQKVFITEFFI